MITRIRELLEARQLTPTQFADLIGVGRPVISHILSERNKPSLEVVQKIIGAFPDISLPWLLAGTGPMLATAPAAPPTSFPETIAEVAPAPIEVTPTIAVAPPAPLAPPIAQPAAFVRPPSISQPGNYPQPPRFRPSAAATAVPANAATAATNRSQTDGRVLAAAPAPAEAPTQLPEAPAATANAATAAAYPSAAPVPTPVAAAPAPVAPAQVLPPATPAASPAPLATDNLGSLAAPTAEPPAPITSSEVPATSHPAAALSFLGEPGKAIRRIVIFYRDGSFSDYQPEGN